MRFEQIEEIREGVNAVVEAAADLNRGDTLTHDMITRAIGLQPYEGRWVYLLKRAFDRIERNRGITMRAEIGVGYRLLTEQEQLTEEPQRRLRRANRQTRKGRLSVARLPTKGLSMHQRKIQAATIQRLKEDERQARKTLKDIAEQARSTPTIARRPHPSQFVQHRQQSATV